MRHVRSSPFFHLVVLPVTLLALLPACQGWVGVETAPGLEVDSSSPTRVTLKDGRQFMLGATIVTADSLFGNRPGTPGSVIDADQSLRVALDDVLKVERRGTDAGATTALIGGIAVVSVLGLVLFANSFEKFLEQTFADQ